MLSFKRVYILFTFNVVVQRVNPFLFISLSLSFSFSHTHTHTHTVYFWISHTHTHTVGNSCKFGKHWLWAGTQFSTVFSKSQTFLIISLHSILKWPTNMHMHCAGKTHTNTDTHTCCCLYRDDGSFSYCKRWIVQTGCLRIYRSSDRHEQQITEESSVQSKCQNTDAAFKQAQKIRFLTVSHGLG